MSLRAVLSRMAAPAGPIRAPCVARQPASRSPSPGQTLALSTTCASGYDFEDAVAFQWKCTSVAVTNSTLRPASRPFSAGRHALPEPPKARTTPQQGARARGGAIILSCVRLVIPLKWTWSRRERKRRPHRRGRYRSTLFFLSVQQDAALRLACVSFSDTTLWNCVPSPNKHDN